MSLGLRPAIAAFAVILAGAALAADNDDKPDKSAIVFACDASHNACLDACQRSNGGANVLSRADRELCENKCTDIYAQCIKSAGIRGTAKAPRTSQKGAIAP
ncbi:MAG TPA: hypothetical protein VFB16_02090 [Bauldia sp.]|nr:hypothetical protein [Bauldia sp.]